MTVPSRVALFLSDSHLSLVRNVEALLPGAQVMSLGKRRKGDLTGLDKNKSNQVSYLATLSDEERHAIEHILPVLDRLFDV